MSGLVRILLPLAVIIHETVTDSRRSGAADLSVSGTECIGAAGGGAGSSRGQKEGGQCRGSKRTAAVAVSMQVALRRRTKPRVFSNSRPVDVSKGAFQDTLL